eukprot:CAMPEP_0115858758 /NCGR_PEP_ID=MMETSP0287-20121206/16263_1 /TAXON_ID=412157 /ORGANISM="Chrysochromulina rotalis, Strain UIO044" /LENGTH=115 /DNA_ID=CAMNT_0003313033 /DNA_START=483 /DNA_END=827 /DNA_ORIENTATION=+
MESAIAPEKEVPPCPFTQAHEPFSLARPGLGGHFFTFTFGPTFLSGLLGPASASNRRAISMLDSRLTGSGRRSAHGLYDSSGRYVLSDATATALYLLPGGAARRASSAARAPSVS